MEAEISNISVEDKVCHVDKMIVDSASLFPMASRSYVSFLVVIRFAPAVETWASMLAANSFSLSEFSVVRMSGPRSRMVLCGCEGFGIDLLFGLPSSASLYVNPRSSASSLGGCGTLFGVLCEDVVLTGSRCQIPGASS